MDSGGGYWITGAFNTDVNGDGVEGDGCLPILFEASKDTAIASGSCSLSGKQLSSMTGFLLLVF